MVFGLEVGNSFTWCCPLSALFILGIGRTLNISTKVCIANWGRIPKPPKCPGWSISRNFSLLLSFLLKQKPHCSFVQLWIHALEKSWWYLYKLLWQLLVWDAKQGLHSVCGYRRQAAALHLLSVTCLYLSMQQQRETGLFKNFFSASLCLSWAV